MADEIAVEADFLNDLRLTLLNALTGAGATVSTQEQGDVFAVCRSYFNVVHKVIAPKRRAVHFSRELGRRALIVAPEIWAGVQLIETRSAVGDSLEDHFSDRARRAHTHDWLRNDWGIHHLHVRPSRGSELLYAWVDDEDMYLVDLLNHQAMADIALLEIVLSNWPQLLEPYEMRGIRGSADGSNPTAAELDDARRSGVQPMLTLSNRKVYAPRGGGLTTARGSSVRAVSDADFAIDRARSREWSCRNTAREIARKAGRTTIRLRYDITTDTAIELGSGLTVGFEDNSDA